MSCALFYSMHSNTLLFFCLIANAIQVESYYFCSLLSIIIYQSFGRNFFTRYILEITSYIFIYNVCVILMFVDMQLHYQICLCSVEYHCFVDKNYSICHSHLLLLRFTVSSRTFNNLKTKKSISHYFSVFLFRRNIYIVYN